MVAGMKYKIKLFFRRPKHWASNGLMDKWMGRTVEVNDIWRGSSRIIKLVEDYGKWNWRPSDFEAADGLSEFNLSKEDFEL